MKRLFASILIALFVLPTALLAAEGQAATTQPAIVGATTQPASFANEQEKISYAIGLNIAKGLKRQDLDIDAEMLIQAMRDVFADDATRLSVAEARQTIMRWQREQQAEQQQEDEVLGAENKKASEEFLAENKDKEGVKTAESGFQYKVLEEGSGASPEPTDKVKVHYRGTLIDGTEFDSSYKRGQPATFVINRVIPGWQKALPMMKVGGKWKLFIPPELAYKDRRQGPEIGPNSLLIFEVELLGIEEASEQAGGAGAQGTQ